MRGQECRAKGGWAKALIGGTLWASQPFRSEPIIVCRCSVRVYFSNDRLSGTGNLWNLSLTGCWVDGNLPVRSGMRFELLILLPGKRAAIIVQEARVPWTRGREFGLRMIPLPPGGTVRLESTSLMK
jgi:hypothetical protein